MTFPYVVAFIGCLAYTHKFSVLIRVLAVGRITTVSIADLALWHIKRSHLVGCFLKALQQKFLNYLVEIETNPNELVTPAIAKIAMKAFFHFGTYLSRSERYMPTWLILLFRLSSVMFTGFGTSPSDSLQASEKLIKKKVQLASFTVVLLRALSSSLK